MYRLLILLTILVAPAARADWHEASTAHFTVYSNQRVESLREFATNLERFDKGMRLMRNLPDEPLGKANRLTVYVVGDTDDVADLIKDRFVAGFYSPRAGGSLAVVPRSTGSSSEIDLSPLAILLHEYSHHFMWSIAPHSTFPAWFVEGWAEYYATADFEREGSIVFGNPPQYRAAGLMMGNQLPIDKLLVADTLKLNAQQREALYGRGWLLTHYLTSGQAERKGQLGEYITAINAGKSPMEAATGAFGDLRKLDKELERYKMGRFAGVRLKAAALTIGAVAIRKLTPGEAATMKVRIRSKVGVTAKTAPGVYEASRKAAAPFPNDPGAQIVLAETAYDAGDFAGAEAAADRALAADPKAVDGHVYKAKAQIGAALKTGDKSKERWAAIRKSIVAGNRIDPDDPEPLILYYFSFGQADQPASEPAKQGLARALELAPEDRSLRFAAAGMFLREGNKTNASTLLAPLAYQPHNRGTAEYARKVVALINAGDVDGALALLNGEPEEKDDADADTG